MIYMYVPDQSVHCCITSPPYWGLRDYGVDGQIGLESTPDEYVSRMVDVFREVRRVLRDDGTLWLNLGDSYNNNASNQQGRGGSATGGVGGGDGQIGRHNKMVDSLKPKDLVGIPWRVAFALQADGWYLRSDIIWAKPNPMPESVTDRPTKAHEYVFLLSKSQRYYYDADAVREIGAGRERFGNWTTGRPCPDRNDNTRQDMERQTTRARRTVWNIATRPFPGAPFAVFPPDLVIPMVDSGTSERGCCQLCGTGWVRVTDRAVPPHIGRTVLSRIPPADKGHRHRKVGGQYQKWLDANPAKTVGWMPSCGCEAKEDEPGILIERPDEATDRYVYSPEPCTVLDPFAGSGTTGLVAVERGRSFIGIELNPEYADMARGRLEQATKQQRLDLTPAPKPEQTELL
jgi:DNA modification methylase